MEASRLPLRTEADLIKDFLDISTETDEFSSLTIDTEMNTPYGRPDIIGIDTNNNHLITFEAKLALNKKVILQACRNKSFSHISFIIVPINTASYAHINLCIDNDIGIILVDKNILKVIFNPKPSTPFCSGIVNSILSRYI